MTEEDIPPVSSHRGISDGPDPLLLSTSLRRRSDVPGCAENLLGRNRMLTAVLLPPHTTSVDSRKGP